MPPYRIIPSNEEPGEFQLKPQNLPFALIKTGPSGLGMVR